MSNGYWIGVVGWCDKKVQIMSLTLKDLGFIIYHFWHYIWITLGVVKKHHLR
jgi:hypothetical protein